MSTDLISDAWVVSVCVGYGVVAVALQMYRVASPRDWLLERVTDLRTRIVSEGWGAGRSALDNLTKWEDDLRKGWWRLPTSVVQAGWRYVHRLEDDHVLELTSDPILEEQLRSAQTQLEGMADRLSRELAKRIEDALKDTTNLDGRRALLQEAAIHRHNLSDTNYEDLAAVLSKAVFLTAISLALIAGLGVLFDRQSYFLFGAAGALISRLSRVLRRRPQASDYGAMWSTLILGPAAGALAGWLSVLIAAVLAGDPLDVLEDAFANPWDDAFSKLGFLIAFIGGFSERWFGRLVSTAEAQLGAALPTPTSEE
jgi:hypothetical protein